MKETMIINSPSFIHKKIAVGEYLIDLTIGGEGYPVLLLHGFPQTKMAWHKIAPRLALNFKVIWQTCLDMATPKGPSPIRRMKITASVREAMFCS